MDPEAFRKHAHEVVDWIADYLTDLETRRVVPAVTPGEIRRALPTSAPIDGEPFEAILTDFKQQIVPGISHWSHPGWFAYFPTGNSAPSLLAEFLTAGLGAQCMSWVTSPAATELEQVVMSWYRQMLQLPETFTGVIQDTASSSTLVAFLTARDRAGGDLSKMVAYWSTEAHSSIAKAARLAGIDEGHQRIIPVDETFAMLPDALDRAIMADKAQGLIPLIVVATMGTTSSTACDPLRAIGEVARRYAAWYHVDAAYGGSAAILPEMRPLLDGIELADSLVTNPHKWLQTHVDFSAYYVRDVEALLHAMSVQPEYLRTKYDADAVNFRDWGIPLGRRFRALKFWFVLRSFGISGLQAIIRKHLALAQELAAWIDADPEFERLAAVPFALVCLRHVPAALRGDEAALTAHNAALMARVNATGRVHLSHTTLGGKYTIRVSIGAEQTERRHVAALWNLLKENVKR